MIHLRTDKSLGEQYILLKRKERKLEKKFVRLGTGTVLAQSRKVKSMLMVDKKLKHIKEALGG